jgi:ANTAR domain-containing protein
MTRSEGPHHPRADVRAEVERDAERLARGVAELSTAALVEDDVHAMLARLCRVAVESLRCRAAGAYLEDSQDGLRLAAASDEFTFRAATRGDAPAGPLGTWTVPLQAAGQRIGLLDLHPCDAAGPSVGEQRVARALADIAGGVVWRLRRHDEDRKQSAQLQHALDSRVVIEQAKGVLCAHLGVSVDEAFRILRFGARDRRVRLRDVAEKVVAGNLQLDRTRGSEPSSRIVRLPGRGAGTRPASGA